MKNTSLFQLSALSLALFGQSLYAAEVSHTCSVSTDCNYSTYQVGTSNPDGRKDNQRFWYVHSAPLGNHDDDLRAILLPQHYQNKLDREKNDRGSFTLIGISNTNFDEFSLSDLEHKRKAHLYIPSGTTAKLDKIGTGTGRLVHLYNADGQIDSSVTLTVGSGKSEEEDSPLMTAIHLGGQSKLDTSADIVVNAIDSEGIWVSDKAQLTAKNHKIDLVSAETEALGVTDEAKAVLDKVTISGDQFTQTGIYTQEQGSIEFNNGSINLTNDILTMALGLYNGKIEFNNSQANAAYAIVADAYGYNNSRNVVANQNTVNITNSNVVGRELFVAVNVDKDGDTPISTNHKTVVNVESSNVSGKVVNLDPGESEELDIRLDAQNNTHVDLTMKNSGWAVNGDSHLNGLAMANSTTSLQKSGEAFQTLTISDYLIGNGHFDLNTDLANQKSDKIIVKGDDSGNFTLSVKDSGNEPNAANGRVTLVETQTGQAAFSLKDRDYVDAGAYRYRLQKEGTNWVLANRQAEQVTSPTPVQPQPTPSTPAEPSSPTTPTTATPAQPVTPPPATPATPVAPTQPAVPTPPSVPTTTPALAELSETSNALVSLRQAQGLLLTQNLQGIHQRLGELKTEKASNVWVKNHNGRTRAQAQNVAVDSRSSGFEMDSHNVQIGADRAVSEQFRVGGFVGTSRANVDFNGEYGKGKLRSQAVGFYATFANDSGWYSDNVAKYERLSTQNAAEKRKYNGFSFSTELGKRIALSNDWSVTPQAQLAYHTLNGKKDESRLTLLTARAGVRVAKGFSLNNGWHLQPYVEANAIAEKANDATVSVNQYRFNVAENRGIFQTALGLTAGNGSHRLGVEISQTHGKQVKQPLNLLANYRYQW